MALRKGQKAMAIFSEWNDSFEEGSWIFGMLLSVTYFRQYKHDE